MLVRYLAQDDTVQSPLATDLLEGKLSAESPGYISSIVLVELCWTLKRLYGVDHDGLVKVLEKLLSTAEFSLEHRDLCWLALQHVKDHKGDFADALIGLIHRDAGCETTLTFDKKASRLETFSLLS